MRIIGHICTKNEGDRYLDSVLSWLRPSVDDLFVWDDRSEDDTREIVLSHGGICEVAGQSVPTFLENEGAFRQAGWESMVQAMSMQSGDWVFTIDADEFLLGDLRSAVETAQEHGYSTLRIYIREIFQLVPLACRIDGFWGKIDGFRATQYVAEESQEFNQGMASGTLPQYARKAWTSNQAEILHVGYATEADRNIKSERYSSVTKNGHNSSHIESIKVPGNLVVWDGTQPNVWRGKREESDGSILRQF